MSLSLSDLLLDIRTELRALNGHFRPTAEPESALLIAILSFVGAQAAFTASELTEASDRLLREAIGDLSAYELGRKLSDLEGECACGRVLTKQARSFEGNVWRFN